MELVVQPDDGAKAVIGAVEAAKRSVDLIIFRFDLKPLEKAIEAAVGRGVAVRTLIANTNSGGEKGLRELEQRMLRAGVVVSRTGGDLVRYHGKLMIIDRDEVYVNGFNFTARDLKSRSFGLVSRDSRVVKEALRLFEADVQREDFEPDHEGMVVSPENAREELATFIKRTKKSLAIWDPKITDTQMLRLLHLRKKAGVDIRIIGKVGKRGSDLRVQKMPGIRLHVRAMVRDGEAAFVGSQSLRALELDARREVGLITRDAKVVKRILEVFEADWVKTDLGKKELKVHEKELALREVAS
ncbi:MAG TPA: phospholipase D-like domain-containing protein [Vicinamibacterales bacterium]|nr:phospholipase D-like domain-containing protein [Vicinamibacterales bacterium]